MNGKQGLAFVLGVVLGGMISFLCFGFMWIGLPVAVQAGASAALFCTLAFVLGRVLKRLPFAFFSPASGAAPLALLLVQFRDKEGSHLMPILIACSWFLGMALGAWLGTRRPKNES